LFNYQAGARGPLQDGPTPCQSSVPCNRMPPSTAQSLGALLKSARDIIGKDEAAWAGADGASTNQDSKLTDDQQPLPIGPKARHVIAWAEASPTSAGPGNPCPRIPRGLQGRNTIRATNVPPFQGGDTGRTTYSRAFSPGYHMAGFQPEDGPAPEPDYECRRGCHRMGRPAPLGSRQGLQG
jgi:hypothetical protein